MTNGSSQGLFVVVAVVIFGIFVLISYVLFRDNLKTGLSSIFEESIHNTYVHNPYFDNSIINKEYISPRVPEFHEFIHAPEWDIVPTVKHYGTDKTYIVMFDAKANKVGNSSLFYLQSNQGSYHRVTSMFINGKDTNLLDLDTKYKHFTVEMTVEVDPEETVFKTSLLAVFGGSSYDSGIHPTVKNMKFYPKN